MTGTIINITRFCTDDGPGIRTTVFFKGCPLRCAWCHNPESQNPMPEQYQNGETIGRVITAQEVLDEVVRDQIYYETSGGGVTLSGGEPLSQPDFAAAILRRCKERNIHTAVETCGFASRAALEQVMEHCDLVLFDIKETDSDRHLDFTGVPSEPIVENLFRIDAMGIPTILRLPIVPGFNDREEHLATVGELAAKLKHCQGMQIMGYHRLGEYKYEQLGRDYRFQNITEPSAQQVAQWEQIIKENYAKK